MTLNEAIKQFEKLASDYEFNLDMHQLNIMKLSVNDIERMKRNAQENRQLADWLKELKALRKNVEKIFNDCDTCLFTSAYPDKYPCVKCSHRYADYYEYDETREVNADE